MKVLTFVTDAFGGRGGIAKFNRDLLTALCSHPATSEILVLPRLVPDDPGELPQRLVFERRAAGAKWGYLFHLLRMLVTSGPLDGVICGHIHLLPIALLAARAKRAPLLLIIHGVEAWNPSSRYLVNRAVRRIDSFVAVSEFSKKRFLEWAQIPQNTGRVIPNCIDVALFGVGSPKDALVRQYGLEGRTVILTLARLSSLERYKGIDEVLDLLPELKEAIPDILYMIVGDGDDKMRLEEKVTDLDLEHHVVFTGYVPESEKADHYRLADTFVMTGKGEGFGIVYLEAMACGVPVIASSADASREAVRYGQLGLFVNPDDPGEIKRAILTSLRSPAKQIPSGLNYFSYHRFKHRWHGTLEKVFNLSETTLAYATAKKAVNVRKKPRPLVSIGMPVFNGESHISQAIESVLGQTVSDLELNICDNASTDATELICLEYARRDSRVRYHRNRTNLGAAPNYNLAFYYSSGKYFKWLAHDDCMAPTYVEKCLEMFESSDPGVVLCFPQRSWIDESDNPIDEPPDWKFTSERPLESYDFLSVKQLLRFRGVDPAFIFGLIRSDVLRNTKMMGSYYGADSVLQLELRFRGLFREVPFAVDLHRCHYGTPEQELRTSIRGWDIWFDPANANRRTGLPSFRLFLKHFSLILRAPISFRARLSAIFGLREYIYVRIARRLRGEQPRWMKYGPLAEQANHLVRSN